MVAIATVAVVAAVFCAIGLLFWGPRVAGSIACGGVVAVANLWILKKIGQAFLSTRASSRGLWGLIAALKFLLLTAGVWYLLRHAVATPLPFVVGYGALPIGITLSVLMRAGQGT